MWTVKVCGGRYGHRQSAESSHSASRLTTSASTTANNKEPTLAAPYQLPIGVAGRAGALCTCGLFLLLQTDGEGEDDAAGDVELEGPALESAGELRLERVLDEFGSEVIDVVAGGLDRKRHALDEGAVTGVDIEIEERVLASAEMVVDEVDALGGDVVDGELRMHVGHYETARLVGGIAEGGEGCAVLELAGDGERPMVVYAPSDLRSCDERAVLIEPSEHAVGAGVLGIEEDIGVGGGFAEGIEVVLEGSVAERRDSGEPVTLPGDGEEEVLGLEGVLGDVAEPKGVVDEEMVRIEGRVLEVDDLVLSGDLQGIGRVYGVLAAVEIDAVLVVEAVVLGPSVELGGPLVVVESEASEERELVVGVGTVPRESERHVEERIGRLAKSLGGGMVASTGGAVGPVPAVIEVVVGAGLVGVDAVVVVGREVEHVLVGVAAAVIAECDVHGEPVDGREVDAEHRFPVGAEDGMLAEDDAVEGGGELGLEFDNRVEAVSRLEGELVLEESGVEGLRLGAEVVERKGIVGIEVDGGEEDEVVGPCGSEEEERVVAVEV